MEQFADLLKHGKDGSLLSALATSQGANPPGALRSSVYYRTTSSGAIAAREPPGFGLGGPRLDHAQRIRYSPQIEGPYLTDLTSILQSGAAAMDGSFSGNLRIWDAAAPAEFQDPPVFDLSHSLAGPHNLSRFAGRLYVQEALGPSAGGAGNGEGAEPYSLQWFLNAEYQRHRKHGRWIPRLLEFGKHSGETLL